MNRLVLANRIFENDEIKVTDLHLEYNATNEEIVVGNMTVRINTTDAAKMKVLQNMAYGTQMMLFRSVDANYEEFICSDSEQLYVSMGGGLYEQFLVKKTQPTLRYVGTFYSKSVKMINGSKNAYLVEAFDLFGLLASVVYPGKFLEASGGYTTGQVLNEVLSCVPTTINTIDAEVSSLAQVTGFLPRMSARDALQKVLFAYGISIKSTPQGANYLPGFRAYLNGGAAAKNVTGDIYIGGDVNPVGAVSKITVWEHSFYPDKNAPYKGVYDNTGDAVAATNKTIMFENPVLDYPYYVTNRNGTIIYQVDADGNVIVDDGTWSRSATSGKLEWTFSGRGVIYAVEYMHVETPIVWENPNVSGEVNEIEIKDNYLINSLNSSYVMERLKKYYYQAPDGSTPQIAQTSFVVRDANMEMPGDLINTTDAFKDARSGYLTSSDLTPSGIMKSVSEMLSNWTPGPFGSQFNNYVLITTSGTFSVPAAARGKAVKVVLIGGGQAGESGHDGTAGATSAGDGDLPQGGTGGAGGIGGDPGKSLVVDIASAANSYSVTIGAAGVRSNSRGTVGGNGGNTIFGSYSSANGTVNPGGVFNLITGDVYALKGKDGTNGADGGSIYLDGSNTADAESGGDWVGIGEVIYPGARGGDTVITADGRGYASGGGGGGSAYYAYGQDGTDGDIDVDHVYTTGHGGYGASASQDADADHVASYGSGGDAGHGGGGGGAGGAYHIADIGSSVKQTGGNGGLGSLAYNGGKGCVIFYY